MSMHFWLDPAMPPTTPAVQKGRGLTAPQPQKGLMG